MLACQASEAIFFFTHLSLFTMQTQSNPVIARFTFRTARFWGATLLGAALLAGCGGGGDDATPTPNPPPAPAPTLSQTQGIWQSAAGAATTVSALVLPDGQLWAVLVNGTGVGASTQLLMATLAVQGSGFSATGKRFVLDGSASAATSVPVGASVKEKDTLSLQLGAGTTAEIKTLVWQPRYEIPVQLSELAGNWSATLGAGTVRWAVDAQGGITGTRTTGCTYSGQFSLRPERQAVVDAQVQEDCAGVRVRLNGVGTLQPVVATATGTAAAHARLNLVLTTADEAQAVLLGLQR